MGKPRDIADSAAVINALDGVTATGTELNLLDGVTATTAELNYVDGVTSAIQTQIDAKAALSSPTFTGTVTVDGLTIGSSTITESANDLTISATDDLLLEANGNRVFQAWDNGSLQYVLISNGNQNLAKFDPNGDISFYEDTGTTAKLFWDASAEKFGIGTTSPSTAFHVDTAANGEIARFQGADAQVVINNTTSSVIDFQNVGTGDDFTFTTNGTERLRIEAGGSVGIGTDSPNISGFSGYKVVSIQGSSGAVLELADSTHVNAIWSADDNLTLDADRTNTGANSYMRFRVDLSEAMRIDSSGNVGIGTTSPAYLVDAYGAVASRGSGIGNAAFVLQEVGNNPWYLTQFTGGAFGILYNGTSSANTKLAIDTSGNVGIGTTSPQYLGHFVDGDVAIVDSDATNNAEKQSLLFGGASGEAAGLAGITGYRGASASAGELIFKTNQGSGITEAMRIDSSGNVGIGTDSPVGLGGATVLQVHDSGTDYAQLRLTNSTSGSTVNQGFELNFSGTNIYINNRENGVMAFYNNGSEAARIDSSRNLLIGQTVGNVYNQASVTGLKLDGANGNIQTARANNVSLLLNRYGTDGNIAAFYKDGTSVASIGVAGSGTQPYFVRSSLGGIKIGIDGSTALLIPCDSSGTSVNGGADLGTSSNSFKDAYFSGTVTANSFSGDGSALTGISSGGVSESKVYFLANS